ncbi:MAG: hypothetical protein ACKV19_26445 [Verrucomicrobiales bacterium]
MKIPLLWAPATALCFLLISVLPAPAETGPFPPGAWPPTVDGGSTVHYGVVNDAFGAPEGASGWSPSLQILSGGDQITEPMTAKGFSGLRATQLYLNIADLEYTAWAEEPEIDILVQVYGDSAVLGGTGNPRNFHFLLGTLPPTNLTAPAGGSIPLEGRNFKWNWFLFRIPNNTRGDGGRYVGSLAPDAGGDLRNGGVNGGTIRMESVTNLAVRAIAFGPVGAFGEPGDINQFAPPDACDPEPATNYVFLDFAGGAGQELTLLNDTDQTSTIEMDIGPVGQKRTAARPLGNYLNFGITNNYLGLPCNPPVTMKLCIEYFDDPAAAGRRFGPEAFATDAVGGVGFASADNRATLAGSGRWMRQSWVVPGVNLRGINTGNLTGGVRLAFTGGPVSISRFDMAVLREGAHPLAGQDPLANCPRDPAACDGVYGNFVEMDLANGLFDGLSPGSSGGDQEMIQEEAGPTEDRRFAVRAALDDGTPGFNHNYLNFAIVDTKLGPNSQPNARLAVVVTYYDDPALAGRAFRPEVFYRENPNGSLGLVFLPASQGTTLQGSGQWIDSYVEIPNIKFNGVNQGPQAAARFVVDGKIAFSRVRYAVIRDCGPEAGVNLLESAKPTLTVERTEGNLVRLRWIAGHNWQLQFNDTLTPANWQPMTEDPIVENFQNVLDLAPGGPPARYFRLVK